MLPAISMLTLGVRDLERARAFYRDGLGWPLSSASGDEVAFFRLAGTVLALWSRDALADDAGLPRTGSGFGGIVLAHNVGTFAEVDAALTAVAAAGGTVLRPGRATEWGGYVGYFADPEGYVWEVTCAPMFVLEPDGRLALPE